MGTSRTEERSDDPKTSVEAFDRDLRTTHLWNLYGRVEALAEVDEAAAQLLSSWRSWVTQD